MLPEVLNVLKQSNKSDDKACMLCCKTTSYVTYRYRRQVLKCMVQINGHPNENSNFLTLHIGNSIFLYCASAFTCIDPDVVVHCW